MSEHPIRQMVRDHKQGRPVGVYSVCSAHPRVLMAAARHSAAVGSLLLVEATCNQVNQFGGYTGLTPSAFRDLVLRIADHAGLAREQVVLGGDHLGPSPWSHEPAESALCKAEVLVAEYIRAGYGKLHLDASMACAGDPTPLPDGMVAERSARLCRVAENVWEQEGEGLRPVYVVGTEVPTPGGARGHEGLQITGCDEVAQTLENLRKQFAEAGLKGVLSRVVGIVVQPGVEFGDQSVVHYDRQAAAELARWIEGQNGLVYEAHSTDYQRPQALRALVEDHFAILKVGPWLTFAMREAVYSLAAIEEELKGVRDATGPEIRQIVERTMREDPRYWRSYYQGDGNELRIKLHFSRSDRLRYYWQRPAVQAALDRLLRNLSRTPIPETLIGQYLPDLREEVEAGLLPPRPEPLIEARIRRVLAYYSAACAMDRGGREWVSVPD